MWPSHDVLVIVTCSTSLLPLRLRVTRDLFSPLSTCHIHKQRLISTETREEQALSMLRGGPVLLSLPWWEIVKNSRLVISAPTFSPPQAYFCFSNPRWLGFSTGAPYWCVYVCSRLWQAFIHFNLSKFYISHIGKFECFCSQQIEEGYKLELNFLKRKWFLFVF